MIVRNRLVRRVRGILCQTCNHGLGMLGDTADALRRALGYLEC